MTKKKRLDVSWHTLLSEVTTAVKFPKSLSDDESFRQRVFSFQQAFLTSLSDETFRWAFSTSLSYEPFRRALLSFGRAYLTSLSDELFPPAFLTSLSAFPTSLSDEPFWQAFPTSLSDKPFQQAFPTKQPFPWAAFPTSSLSNEQPSDEQPFRQAAFRKRQMNISDELFPQVFIFKSYNSAITFTLPWNECDEPSFKDFKDCGQK